MIRKKKARVFVWDPNPFNPYGTELARVIGGIPNIAVSHYTRKNRPYRTKLATSAEIIPEPAAGNPNLLHAMRYLRALISFFIACISKRPIIVFPWIVNRWEVVAARMLQKFGLPTIIVVHNPIKERDEVDQVKGLRVVRDNAAKLVVHTDQLKSASSTEVAVAAHPSYKAWDQSMSGYLGSPTFDNVTSAGGATAVFVGSTREDKGFFGLPNLAQELMAEGMHLLVCIGIYKDQDVAALKSMPNVTVVGDGNSYLSDEALYSALKKADVMVAPYKDVTVSGTVLLALTLGLPVVAFECAEFSRVLGPTRLAPQGDLRSLAHIASVAVQANHPRGDWADTQDHDSRANWMSILRSL